jgi:glucose/arabinose dehydrogenase
MEWALIDYGFGAEMNAANDGSLLVSDYGSGSIWRVSYKGK